MDFLGIGLWEMLLIAGLAFVILGPQDLAVLGRKAGVFLRNLMMSDEYKEIKRTQRAISNLPNKLIREAGIDQKTILPKSNKTLSSPPLTGSGETPTDQPVISVPETPAEDPVFDAWAHPGTSVEDKHRAMRDDVKRGSSRARKKSPVVESQVEDSIPPGKPSDQTN